MASAIMVAPLTGPFVTTPLIVPLPGGGVISVLLLPHPTNRNIEVATRVRSKKRVKLFIASRPL